jgi:hypothetical protein
MIHDWNHTMHLTRFIHGTPWHLVCFAWVLDLQGKQTNNSLQQVTHNHHAAEGQTYLLGLTPKLGLFVIRPARCNPCFCRWVATGSHWLSRGSA